MPHPYVDEFIMPFAYRFVEIKILLVKRTPGISIPAGHAGQPFGSTEVDHRTRRVTKLSRGRNIEPKNKE